ncbi:MAG: holo-ACP synthase [Planctomycetota bacterium]|nr:holo-ACP synthase [Planctomycetota bacterium]
MPDHPPETVISHGVDLVEVARIQRMLGDHPERFAERCFTPSERAYCDEGDRRRAERYAARFAAKEAVMKALGTGWRDGMAWTDIEVRRQPSGAPVLFVTGRAAEIASGLGIRRRLISLSHTDGHAFASVIALGAAPPGSGGNEEIGGSGGGAL